MESSMDHLTDRVSFTQTNPLFDMSLSRSDLYSFQPEDLKAARPRRRWCFYFIIIYLILQTGLNAFLIYKVFTLESSLSKPRLEKQTSNHIPQDGDLGDNFQILLRNNSQETKNLKANVSVLQSQVNGLCGEKGQLHRLASDLNLLNTSTLKLEGRVSSISLRPGPPGPAGSRGPSGEKGPKGDSGAAGPKGGVGPKGERGDAGPPGSSGSQGPGAKGEKGDAGVQGQKGDMGEAGHAGIPGVPGIKGDKGDRGHDGGRGITGPMGPPGFNGTQGPPGPAGPKGEGGEQELKVRLVPGTRRGRLEVKYNGVWGTVCDDNFDSTEGMVVCKMLGFQSVFATFTASPGTGKIWLDDLHCSGTEGDIFACPHAGVGNNNCQHSEDVGVQCV